MEHAASNNWWISRRFSANCERGMHVGPPLPKEEGRYLLTETKGCGHVVAQMYLTKGRKQLVVHQVFRR